MGKVKYLIIAAGLFVCFVMGLVTIQGVHLTERRIIKWSTVPSGVVAGHKVATFMFPIIKEYRTVVLIGQGTFPESFRIGFTKRVAEQNPEARVYQGSVAKPAGGFRIEIVNLEDKTLNASCLKGDSMSCVAMKATRLFAKKERSVNDNWISMYRLSKNRALIIYRAQSN